MNILHVTPYYAPAWAYGGVVQAVTGLAEAQVEAGHQVTVLTTDTLDRSRRIATSEEVLRGVQVIRRRNLSVWGRARLNLSTPVGFAGAAFDLLRKDKADIIHCHEFRTAENLLVSARSTSRNQPLVVSPHGTLPYNIGRRLSKQAWDQIFGRTLIRRFDHVIALTPTEAENAFRLWYRLGHALPEDRISVIPNAVRLPPPAEIEQRARFREQWGLREGPVIVFLGRLAERKRLHMLIAAFATLMRHHPDARLLIVGPDEGVLARLRAQIDDLDLGARVTFTGLLAGQETQVALQASDIFTLPAAGEGMSMSTLEAMASGLPVVLCEDTSAPPIEAANAGMIVSATPEALAGALASLVGDEARRVRMGARARDLVIRDFTWKAIAPRIEHVYRRALERSDKTGPSDRMDR